MSFWYKNTGDWWANANLKPNDGISLEEQLKDPNSLFNFYKKIIKIKQNYSAIAEGIYVDVENNNSSIFSFYRKEGNNTMLVTVNLSNKIQEFIFNDFHKSTQDLLELKHQLQNKTFLKPFQISIWKIK